MESTKSNTTQYDPVEIIEDVNVNASKVKSDTAVFGLHARWKLSTHPQVDSRFGGVPIIRGSIPLRDVVWRCVGVPNFGDRRLDDGFNSDFHRDDFSYLAAQPTKFFYSLKPQPSVQTGWPEACRELPEKWQLGYPCWGCLQATTSGADFYLAWQ